MLCLKYPPVVKEFSGDGPFELCFGRNCDLTFALSGQSALAVGHPHYFYESSLFSCVFFETRRYAYDECFDLQYDSNLST